MRILMSFEKPNDLHGNTSSQFGRQNANAENTSSSEFYKTARKTSSSFVTITELPINGYLSIDNYPLHIHQKIHKEDIARLLFNVTDGISRNYYGNFKFIINDDSNKPSEHNFVIDADIINNSLEIKNDEYTEKDKSKETLKFISKRKSDFDQENSDSNWLDATSLDLFDA